MSLPARGISTSKVEITHVSSHGIWILNDDQELFMSYEEFPWFKDQPLKNILYVQEQSPGHFYWPEMDIDLTVEIIKHPERFPLKSCVF
jgi:hypothetical protein